MKEIRVWPQEAISSLQGCFECTQWSIFRDAATSGDCINLEEYTEAVLGFINKCTDDVTVKKSIKVYSTNKPWLTGEVCSLLRLRDAAFRSGDTVGYARARSNLKKGIRQAKKAFGIKLSISLPTARTTRGLWQGFQMAHWP